MGTSGNRDCLFIEPIALANDHNDLQTIGLNESAAY